MTSQSYKVLENDIPLRIHLEISGIFVADPEGLLMCSECLTVPQVTALGCHSKHPA